MNPNNMKMTAEEKTLMDWCYSNLNEEQALEIEEEAVAFASAEINAPEAANKLLPLLVEIMVRNAREQGGEE